MKSIWCPLGTIIVCQIMLFYKPKVRLNYFCLQVHDAQSVISSVTLDTTAIKLNLYATRKGMLKC